MKKEKILYVVFGLLLGVFIAIIIFNIPCVKYDVNRDGKVDALDLLKEQKYILKNIK